jgi:hypothetical protein
MVDKVTLGQISSGYFGFPCQLVVHFTHYATIIIIIIIYQPWLLH